MQDFTGLTIDYGDNPPELHQLTINNRPIDLGPDLDMTDFRFITSIFPGTYWIYSSASAPRERSGPYFSELLYQIEVTKSEDKFK